MSEDLGALRAEVRDFVAGWRFTPRCDAWLRGHDREFSRALAARGWIGMTWPTDLGGGGRSNLARLVVTEELLRAGAPVAAHWMADRQIGPAILRHGSRALQEEFLPRIAAGDATFCLGMSETEAGSDLAAVRTTATRQDEEWILRGAKIWTSHAHDSDYAYVLARTSHDGRKHDGLTEFVVDLSGPGVTVNPILDVGGEHHFNELLLDDVRVPARWVIGEEGNGWAQVTAQLAFERAGAERILSTYPIVAALVAELASRPEDGVLAEATALLVARLRALRGLCWEVAAAMDRGEAPVAGAARLKLLGTELEGDIAEVARGALELEPSLGDGLAGLVAGGLLAAPGFTVRGGTSEVLTGIVARAEGG